MSPALCHHTLQINHGQLSHYHQFQLQQQYYFLKVIEVVSSITQPRPRAITLEAIARRLSHKEVMRKAPPPDPITNGTMTIQAIMEP